MSKTGLLKKIIQEFTSEITSRLLKSFITIFVRRTARKLMLMIAGITITVVGSLFLFLAFAEYLNEMLHSRWMGWGIGGLVVMVVGLITYVLSRQ